MKSNKSLYFLPNSIFLQFQKWPKIHFWTWKKFEPAKNAISRKIFIWFIWFHKFFFFAWTFLNFLGRYVPFDFNNISYTLSQLPFGANCYNFRGDSMIFELSLHKISAIFQGQKVLVQGFGKYRGLSAIVLFSPSALLLFFVLKDLSFF